MTIDVKRFMVTAACIIAVVAGVLAAPDKAGLTPTFWQRDPAAEFPDEGRQHCGPTCVSNGLIYLARALDLPDLVPGDDRKAQIALIHDLAEKMGTDPERGGTTPDKIVTGLRQWFEESEYDLDRLEIATWRPVSKANRPYRMWASGRRA